MFSCTSNVEGNVNELVLVGRLDVKAIKEAEAAFAEAVQAATDIIVDMSELDYIASAGLRALKRLRNDVRANGGRLVLRDVQENVMDVFEMTGFAALLDFE